MASPAHRRPFPRHRCDHAAAAAEGIDFKAIVESTLDVILHCNEDAIASYVSPAITALIGRTPAELVGRRHLEHVLPHDMPALMEAFKAHQAGQLDGRASFRMVRKDGSTVWVEGRGRMLKDPATDEVTLVIVLRDISDCKALEAKLALLALTNAAPHASVAKTDRVGERGADGPRERPRPVRSVN